MDLALYPLDTIKTRLQSADGFRGSGGFRGVYSGLGSVLLGSAPGAALFFVTYETAKHSLLNGTSAGGTLSHMAAAAVGEMAACLVRVPCEVVKQRSQAGRGSVLAVARALLAAEGPWGFYRGLSTTVFREVPFSLIQFPLWEQLKVWAMKDTGQQLELWKSAACGAVAGSIAAFATTPLDVAKTRIMLARHQSETARGGTLAALRSVYGSNGISGLFAGAVPRVMWISLGGAVFLGGYDVVRRAINRDYSAA